MARTRAILLATFGRDLGGLVRDYFTSNSSDPLVFSYQGCYEECEAVFYISLVNNAMCGACEGGYANIVDLMIARGADDWTGGLFCACAFNQESIARLMCDKGASRYPAAYHIAEDRGHYDLALIVREILSDLFTNGRKFTDSISIHGPSKGRLGFLHRHLSDPHLLKQSWR